MTLKQRLRIAAATSLIWILCLSSCAGLRITTWFLNGKGEEAQQGLDRKSHDGTLQAHKSWLEADGYHCYSPIDDEAWRTRMATLSECCEAKQ